MRRKLTRRPHEKGKTGCRTCKSRRVKCSEERPSCSQCVGSNRLCGGYATDGAADLFERGAGKLELSTANILQSVRRLSSYTGDRSMSPLEQLALRYFIDRTVLSLSGYFESSLWERLVLQLGHAEPGLRHAMIAIGFLQKLSEVQGFQPLDLIKESATLPAQHDDFALNQYVISVSLTRKLLSEDEPDVVTVLVACILFVCLEFLRGERKAALVHLKSGIDIIRSKTQKGELVGRSPNTTRQKLTGLGGSDLALVFARLGLISTLHRQPKSDHFVGVLDLEAAPRSFAEPFKSLEEAKVEGVNMANAAMRFVWMITSKKFIDEQSSERARAATLENLEEWSLAFEPYLEAIKFRGGLSLTRQLRGPAILRVQNVTSMIWTKTARVLQDEGNYDAHLEDFKSIVIATNAIINATDRTASCSDTATDFTLDYGLIPSLLFVARKCRDPSTRRYAIALLDKVPRMEGAWDALVSAKIAELHVSIEEELVSQPSSESWPPLAARIIDFDILMRNSKNPFRQLVRFRMVRRGGQVEPDVREDYIYYRNIGMKSIPYLKNHRMKELL